MERDETNWSELVEDLVDGGEVEKAISLLESVVSNLQTDTDCLQLSSALFDLSKLYSSQGFSLKSDEIRTRALIVRERSRPTHLPQGDLKLAKDDAAIIDGSSSGQPLELKDDVSLCKDCSDDDDWEAIADHSLNDLRLSPKSLPSKPSLDDVKVPTPKRRGRGTFAYKKEGLYSDQLTDGNPKDDDDSESQSSEKDSNTRIKCGTRHILVLADFPLSTTTRDLEKLLDKFKSSGFVIRWVNDTVALAVFRSSSLALEAFNCMKCAFTVRVLEENDALLSSIRPRDLDPPRQRPQTSTRTAQRLIAQGMGLKLQSTNFGSKELREQEEARRNRIVSRQNMKEDAWGED
ncbi:uncharacterized protein LOC124920202 isoform X2 [Impatiens glandulifera]|uniref:uncharacterized protein LOC124920202 isoform X2 n=1 Tax=Impatiens glandulifera TaxID=253017 RepID=UPI001FB113EA|nr:uncharacterized protein LOC124920202 isoform X2 [Impatiens glandulifera]